VLLTFAQSCYLKRSKKTGPQNERTGPKGAGDAPRSYAFQTIFFYCLIQQVWSFLAIEMCNFRSPISEEL